MIYHITSQPEWQSAQENGAYRAPSLDTQGFIHFSTRTQVITVANLFYQGQSDLVLLCVDEAQLKPALKWEPPDMSGHDEKDQPHGKALFPHVYGEVNLDAVVQVVNFPANGDGSFTLPETLP